MSKLNWNVLLFFWNVWDFTEKLPLFIKGNECHTKKSKLFDVVWYTVAHGYQVILHIGVTPPPPPLGASIGSEFVWSPWSHLCFTVALERMFDEERPQSETDAGVGVGHAQLPLGGNAPLPENHLIKVVLGLSEVLAEQTHKGRDHTPEHVVMDHTVKDRITE